MKNVELLSFPGPDALAAAAAAAWLDEIEAANRAGKSHCVALSGGRITQKFFLSTAEKGLARGVSFKGVHFFWADERCVPPDDDESNYKLASDLLFEPLKISDEQIHRLRGELPPAEAVAMAIADLTRIAPGQDGQPIFDLIFLGMGEDGHVASLFPGESESVMADRAVYRAVTAVKPPPRRMTLGYEAIAQAAEVWVMVSGAGKEKALGESLSPAGKTPLARVLRLRTQTKIVTDVRPQ